MLWQQNLRGDVNEEDVTGGDVNEGEDNTKEWGYEELEDGTVAVSAYRKTATEVTIPATLGGKQVTAIGFTDYLMDGVFYEKAVTRVTIPEGVKTIGNNTFNWCASLTQVDIPGSVTTIGESAFYGCESLAGVTLPEKLTSIIIPKHVTRQKPYYLCGGMEEVTILNKQCIFDVGEDEERILFPGTKIRGYKDSTAQEYAKTNGNAFEIIPEECTQHSYEESVITAATCTRKGEEKYSCTNCGHSYTKEIPQTGHNFVTQKTPVAPGRDGSVVTKCGVCGNVSENRAIAAPKTMSLSKSSLTCNGEAQTVAVTVKDSAGKTIQTARAFLLLDMDQDGLPELVVMHPDAYKSDRLYVYTYKSGNVVQVKNMDGTEGENAYINISS